ncbi:MAG: UDP-glucose 4-epimerase GalE [Pseudomonadota bacterium]
MTSKILVAGGAGYIGSHACKALAEAGFQPVVLDNLSSGHSEAVQWGPLIQADLGDKEAVAEILKREQVDAVMQFAASIEVGESVTDPGKYYANNVANSINLLNAMEQAGVNKIVFSSTAATYGVPQSDLIDESHPQIPINPYGETKLAVERALHWHDQAGKLRYAALRYFNAAGADPDGKIGEAHDPETHLIPLVIQATLGNRPPMKVFGSDYDTRDGTAIRDFIHVADLAEAHVAALKRLLDGGASLRANLGTGQGYSVREVLSIAGSVAKSDVPHEEADRRAGDPPVLVANPSLAMNELGWKPVRSDLETIVDTALRWHSKPRFS